MKNFLIAFRSLFKKGHSNGIKILSLGVGLALGLVLISKICFERSYDDFYPDFERIYRIHCNVVRNKEFNDYEQVSGGVAPGMKAEIPEVEAATRVTPIGGDEEEVFFTSDKKRYTGTFLMADSCFFDVFPRPVLIGDPKDILSRPTYVMVSRTFAEKLGGLDKVVGLNFKRDKDPKTLYTVGGVFEDVPENTHLKYDILVSMASMPAWSLTNWMGNDRYLGYIKLYPGVKPESLAPAIRKMQEQHQDLDELTKAGVDLSYYLKTLLDLHSGSKAVKDMNATLGFLAFVLIFAAVLNYILIVISTLIGRTKEVAVHKCYGASDKNLASMILSETCLHLLLSLCLAIFLILVFRGTVEDLLSASLSALFTPQTNLILLGVCLAVLALTGLIPTYIFLRIPVAAAFRTYKESRRYWKLCLLFVQFVAAAYLIILLLVINRQYDRMIHDNPGYQYENVLYCPVDGVNASLRQHVLNQLSATPGVDMVSSCSYLPLDIISGNNIYLPGEFQELFNTADLYDVGDNYFSLMEIPVVEGEAFRNDGSASDKVMVSRSFEKKMEEMAGWKDGVVGKSILVTEHSQDDNSTFIICGVYEDFRLGSLNFQDMRPSIMFYSQKPSNIILVKMDQLGSDNIQKVIDVFEESLPNKDIVVTAYQDLVIKEYRTSRQFRNSMVISGIVTLIIALIGLLGYTSDETSRRGREIAIRKVNGATAWDILRMISKDVTLIAVPGLIIGAVIARFSGEQWLEQFVEKIPLSFTIFIGGILCIYLIIISCVLYRAWSVANENPVNSIKSE